MKYFQRQHKVDIVPEASVYDAHNSEIIENLS